MFSWFESIVYVCFCVLQRVFFSVCTMILYLYLVYLVFVNLHRFRTCSCFLKLRHIMQLHCV